MPERDETVEDALDQASEELRNSSPPQDPGEGYAEREAALEERAREKGRKLQPDADE